MLIGSSMAADLLGFLVAQARSGDADGSRFAAGAVDRYTRALDASRDADGLFTDVHAHARRDFERFAKSESHSLNLFSKVFKLNTFIFYSNL